MTTNDLDDLTAHLVTIPADQFDAVVAFYDDWTSASSDDHQRIVAQSGGVTWLRTSGPADAPRTIAISAVDSGQNTTFVTLTDTTG